MPTPNMNLILPVPGEGGTPGPTWAEELNENLETIDEHDHAGSGVAIPSAGLGIDADLTFNEFDATDLRAVRFESQASNPAQNALIFVKNGELTYKDSSGNVVPLTAGGSVAGATGSITGLVAPASAVFSGVTNSFTWLYDSAKTARMASADLILYPYDGSTAFAHSITVKVPTAIAAAYSITLPTAVPSQAGILAMSTGGVISHGLPDGTAGAPGAAWNLDADTGFYRIGANSIGLSLGGTLRIDFSIGNLVMRPDGNEAGRFTAGQLQMASGTAAAPSLSFGSAAASGFYHITGTSVGLSLNGVQRMDLSVDNLIMKPDGSEAGRFTPAQLQMVDGTGAAPSYAFGNNANMGVFRAANNVLGFATSGAVRQTITSSGMQFYEASAGQGEAKWKVFTGTIAASGTTTLTNPGSTLLGAFGATTTSGGSNYRIMAVDPGGVTGAISFSDTGVTANNIILENTDGSNTNTYRVIMFYTP